MSTWDCFLAREALLAGSFLRPEDGRVGFLEDASRSSMYSSKA